MFKKLSLLVLVVFGFVFQVKADQNISAVRRTSEDWKITAARFEFNNAFNFKLYKTRLGKNKIADELSAYDSRHSQVDLNKIPEFGKSDAEYYQMFTDIRDKRFLKDPDVADFPRRISWLYPYDGCFARAEHVARLIKKTDEKAEFKRVFIFGNLEVETPNSTTGSVSWWYHVAVIFKSQGKAFVIDPSLNYQKPIELGEWVKMMVPEDEEAELAVCSAWTYVPDSNCNEKRKMSDESATRGISRYLSAERTNLIDLGRDPEVELGQNPPWL